MNEFTPPARTVETSASAQGQQQAGGAGGVLPRVLKCTDLREPHQVPYDGADVETTESHMKGYTA